MSSTNRGSARRPNDDYQTPPWAINELLKHVTPFGLFLEPCAGSGNIYKAVRPHVSLAVYCEITSGSDFLAPRTLKREYDWIITNPPYALAREFIARSLLISSNTAMLLRLNFLESEERRAWWQSRLPSAIYVLARRPNFLDRDGNPIRGKRGRAQSDSCAYGWFVWSSLYKGIHVIGDPNRNGGKP